MSGLEMSTGQAMTSGVAGEAGDGGRRRVLRAMYVANILGAGLPGLIITLLPRWAREEMFSVPQDAVFFGMLGSIWLAIGIVSALGLRYPLQFSAIFAVQAIYKALWILTVAIPHFLRGERAADVVPMGIFFAIVVACWLVGAPYGFWFGRRATPAAA